MKNFSVVAIILSIITLNHCNRESNANANAKPTVNILFIGNSYTQVNDLPSMFVNLAATGNHAVHAEMVAVGGWRLIDHANSKDTLDRIKSRPWSFVVLQDQSLVPSMSFSQNAYMFPASRTLVKKIREMNAVPIFYNTWARKNGWPENHLNDFAAMQNAINEAYEKIALELNATVSPVGQVWAKVAQQNPEIQLWQADDSHPTEAGIYLAACVFYTVLFRESPENLKFTAQLPKEVAKIIQHAAAENLPAKN